MTFIVLLSVSSVFASSSIFCPRLPPPDSAQIIEEIESGDVSSLLLSAYTARPGTTLLLATGTYKLTRGIEVVAPRVTIRSASGRREDVIIEGGGNNISINSSDVTVADVTLRAPTFHNIQVRGEKGVLRSIVYNVHLIDAGQQFVKVTTGDGAEGPYADDGLVACSLFEYMTFSRGTAHSPPSYTDGVDILAGKGWVIRDNVFRRIRSQAGPAGPAILVWRNALDTVIMRNLIIDSWRGIALGLAAPNQYSRGGAGVVTDHRNGLVQNNVFLALTEPADAAIENHYALNSQVVHNTAFYNDAIDHPVHWSIEYRYAPTQVTILNNLTNLPILRRKPFPKTNSVIRGNMTHAARNWFRGLDSGDFHLAATAPAIDVGVPIPGLMNSQDIDGEPRVAGETPDAGADEFSHSPAN